MKPMAELPAILMKVTFGFLAVMNPIGNAPIFLGLSEGCDHAARRAMALRSVICAFLIVAVFAVTGNLLFWAFGITLPAFRIAGGLLLFAMGYQLLHGRLSAIHHPEPEARERKDLILDVAITPLGTPVLAGPGTITAAISFAAPGSELGHGLIVLVVLGVFAGICVLTYICFVFAERLVTVLSPALIKVASRLMGILLTVIAAQMVIQGVVGAVEAYKSGLL
jgi:multiple antibiotic resistance protein